MQNRRLKLRRPKYHLWRKRSRIWVSRKFSRKFIHWLKFGGDRLMVSREWCSGQKDRFIFWRERCPQRSIRFPQTATIQSPRSQREPYENSLIQMIPPELSSNFQSISKESRRCEVASGKVCRGPKEVLPWHSILLFTCNAIRELSFHNGQRWQTSSSFLRVFEEQKTGCRKARH